MSDTNRQFQNVTITREQYTSVRQMATEATKAKLEQASTARLIEVRFKLQQFRSAVTVKTVKGVVIVPVLYIERVKAEWLKGKRWAYRKALDESIATINAILTARGNVVSPLVADEVQAGAAPATAPALENTERAQALAAELAGSATTAAE